MPPGSVKLKKSRAAAATDTKCNTKKSKTNVQTLILPYLHHDIWFEILSWLSATCLYNIMSRVCNTIIRNPSFVETHLCRSRSGLFLQGDTTRFLELINDKVEITDFKLTCPGVLYSTYQGVCLLNNYEINASYVVNPVTMQIDEISWPFLVPDQKGNYSPTAMHNYCVIRDRRSGELKLVFASQQLRVCYWYVQKLGIENSWKKISGSIKFDSMNFPGLSIGGFLVYEVCNNSILAFDVSDETIHWISCPKLQHFRVTYLPMGNDLSCISHNSERIYIHILKDFHAGKWSLYQILDNGYIHGKPLEFQRFLGWINNSEELLVRLCTFDSCYKLGSCYKTSCYKSDARYKLRGRDSYTYCTYNLKAKRIRYLDKYMSEEDLVRVHTNSLLSWKPLQA